MQYTEQELNFLRKAKASGVDKNTAFKELKTRKLATQSPGVAGVMGTLGKVGQMQAEGRLEWVRPYDATTLGEEGGFGERLTTAPARGYAKGQEIAAGRRALTRENPANAAPVMEALAPVMGAIKEPLSVIGEGIFDVAKKIPIPIPGLYEEEREGEGVLRKAVDWAFTTPEEYWERTKDEIPEPAKEFAKEQLGNAAKWYEGLPEDKKQSLKETGFLGDFLLNVWGAGAAVKPLAKAGIKKGGKVLEAAGKGVQRQFQKLTPEGAEKVVSKGLDTMIDTSIEKSIRPTVRGKKTIEAVDRYKDNARSAVKSIAENKGALKITSELGEEIELPDSLRSFSESIRQTKQKVFNEYDTILKQAGDTGVVLDTVKLADDLAEIKKSPKWAVIEDNYPEVVKYVDNKIGVLESRGTYTLEQGQEAIKAYNSSLEAFYRNPTPDGFGKVTVDAMIVNNMRKNLDDVIGGATGAEYQTLKNQYGALRAIEEDVAKRVIVNARKNQKGLIDFTDIFSAGDIIGGLTTFNPALLAKGTTQHFIKNWFKSINDPDNIIKKMFKEVDASTPSSIPKGGNYAKQTPKTKSPVDSKGKVEQQYSSDNSHNKTLPESTKKVKGLDKAEKPPTSYQGIGSTSGKATSRGVTVDNMFSKIDGLAPNNKANTKAIDVINKVAENPNTKITVYRASPGDKINRGDWVFLTEDEAVRFTKTPMGSPKKGYKVLSEEAKASDIGWTGKNLEFVYEPPKPTTLTSSAKKAKVEGVKPNPMIQEAKKYKTADEFVNR